MAEGAHIAANVARLRLDRQLTQEALATKARAVADGARQDSSADRSSRARGPSPIWPRPWRFRSANLLHPVRPLENVRFRARTRVHAREQILAEVSKWLDAYIRLEADLNEYLPFRFQCPSSRCRDPVEAARAARRVVGLGPEEPVHDICGLLEENGVKLLLLETKRDSFFGLSVGADDGGPAVVVNTWGSDLGGALDFHRGRTSWVTCCFTPPSTSAMPPELPMQAEREADAFASEFLMPEAAFAVEWDETRGHSLLVRVLKVKRIFRVSYKTVLYRLVGVGAAIHAMSGAHSKASIAGTSARRFARPMNPNVPERASSRGTGADRGNPRASFATTSSRTVCRDSCGRRSKRNMYRSGAPPRYWVLPGTR